MKDDPNIRIKYFNKIKCSRRTGRSLIRRRSEATTRSPALNSLIMEKGKRKLVTAGITRNKNNTFGLTDQDELPKTRRHISETIDLVVRNYLSCLQSSQVTGEYFLLDIMKKKK